MKQAIATLAISSTLFFTACTKTENATTSLSTTQPTDIAFGVEVDGTKGIVMIDGQAQIIDLSEIAGDMDFENVGREVQMYVTVNGEEVDGMPNDMMEHVMKMVGDHGGPRGEWWGHNREHSEEHQFMEELDLLGAVSEYLNDMDAVALMGIHMIRDELEGDFRMEALEEIIEESNEGSAVRNAAIFVAIQTMQEVGNEAAAAELMVELVLSN